DAQTLDVRRFMGYTVVGDLPVGDTYDNVYAMVAPGVFQTLFHRLNSLQDSEETILVNVYLANLRTLEQDILDARTNLDTLEAGPWIANPNEIGRRSDLFAQWRRNLCTFLGFPPGPGLGTGGLTVLRA